MRRGEGLASALSRGPDFEYAEHWYGKAPTDLIAEAIGVPELTLLLHLRDRAMIRELLIRTGLPWEVSEDRLLMREYANCDTARIADRLSRTPLSVVRRARALGLRKSRWGIGERGRAPTEKSSILVQRSGQPDRNAVSFEEPIRQPPKKRRKR